MEDQVFDVLVVGAGASGLMAAHEIAQSGRTVAVIEAKERTGGRMFTAVEDGLWIETGAEFVHGNLPLTKEWLKKAGAKTDVVRGSICQYKDGRLQQQEDFIEDYADLEKKCKALPGDKPVSQFLREELSGDAYEELRYTLKNYVEGYDAADTTKASTLAMWKDLSQSDEEQSRIQGGYRVLVSSLEQACRNKGVQFFLSQPVLQLHWKRGEVELMTAKGSFKGQKAVLTVSIGVLKNDAITFFPALPAVKKVVDSLGFGHVVKLVMQFTRAFWQDRNHTRNKDLADLSFLFSREEMPTWWTHFHKQEPVLTAWLGGPRAEAMQFFGQHELTAKALRSLSRIFNLEVDFLRQEHLRSWFYNWSEDPFFYGAYSYAVVNGNEAIKFLQQPVEETVFFAGEGLNEGPEIGTVEGALVSGRDAAQRVLRTFSA